MKKNKYLNPREKVLLEEIDMKKWQKIAGILKESDEDLATADVDSPIETGPPQGMGNDGIGDDHQTKMNGDDIHILNSSNAEVKETKINGGHPYNYLKLGLTQDLSESDIDQLIKELQIFKDRLSKMNTPQK
jgi:hypothetical protein